MVDWNSCVLWLDSKYFSESWWWDRSKYVNDGIVYGAKFKENGFYFNGNNYVIVNHNETFIFDEISVEIVYKLNSIETWDTLVSKGWWSRYRPFLLGFGSGNQIYSAVNTVGGTCGIYWGVWGSVNKKTHLVFTYDSINGMKTYYNGIPKNTSASKGNIDNSNPVHLFIGAASNNTKFIDGKIYLVRIFNKALSYDNVKILVRNAGV